MKPMTLLKAMSELDPADIAGAMEAGKGGTAGQKTGNAESAGHGNVIIRTAKTAPSAGRFMRIGGWAAAAACMMLAVGAVMFFRQDEGDFVLTHSTPEQIEVLTGTEAAGTTVTAGTQTTAVYDGTQLTQAEASGTETLTQAEAVTVPDEESVPVLTEASAETQTTAAATTAAVTYPAEIPVLVAMADDAGRLSHEDGSYFADSEATLKQIQGAAAVQAYLDSPAPVVTLGEGQKDAATIAAIRRDPVMYHICWQKLDAKWDSYGIESAELDSEGVLHLRIAMYSDGTPKPQPEWIYETALLGEAGTMPQITDIRIEFDYYEDTDGIGQWLSYEAALAEDVIIRNLT